MCGIAGLFLRRPAAEEMLSARAAAMAEAIAHRGPDGAGLWTDPRSGLALAHRRLAVIDLSPGGAQPMRSTCGRYVISYNGELYNYRELREELARSGHRVHGDSDTAVLLAALAAWGVEAALPRLDAMFAFALWDSSERALWLARDHAGIKPLVWAQLGDGTILFGSELGALEAAGLIEGTLDAEAIALFLRHACIPAPRTVLRGVRKLPPGGLVRIGLDGEPAERRWFDVCALARESVPAPMAPEEAAEAVDAELERCVRRQLVADVPVGAFLSGGIDSSSVTAAMARSAPGTAHAFTIGFDDPRYDESEEAAAIARALGIRHTVLRATVAEAAALVSELPAVYDEPFADASQVPTLLLCRLARGHVTVALSGDGGDELFGGYRRHVFAARHWPRLRAVPLRLRRSLATLLEAVPERTWDTALAPLPGRPRRPGETMRKLAAVLSARDLDDVYARLTTQGGAVAPCAEAPEEPLRRFRVLDAAGYLHDDVLTKVDRASMSVALEVRVPMLSPSLLRLAFSLPSALLVRKDGGKAVLRDALARHLARPLFERKKSGFAVPLADWLRGRLRGWAEAMLNGRALGDSGLVDRARVLRLWRAHLTGSDASPALWPVLMLAAWLESRAAR